VLWFDRSFFNGILSNEFLLPLPWWWRWRWQ
jgi:hypothetical protein